MRDKWNLSKDKKGYLKIHIAVNVKTKKILSIKVTDEHIHDSKALPELIENIIASNNIKAIGKLFADDGAYEGNDIFRCLAAYKGIFPCIKVRKNAKIKLKTGHILRNLSVLAQRNDLQKWKDRASAMERDGLLKQCFLV
jgi:Transposase DDE domain